MRLSASLVLAATLCCGCSAKKVGKKQKEESAAATAPTHKHPLQGDWSATVTLPRHGSVVGSAVVEPSGEGIFIVTLKGVKKNGLFRIVDWTQGKLAIEVEGQRFEVYAHLDGDELDVQAPGLGTATLRRNP